MLNIKQVIADGIEGDFAELGVWRGNTAAVLAHYAANSGRKVFLFDTFQGFDSKDLKGIDAAQQMQFADTSVDLVKEVIGTHSDVCEFERGYFPDSLRAEVGQRQRRRRRHRPDTLGDERKPREVNHRRHTNA